MTAESGTSINKPGEFRKFLPDLDSPRFQTLKKSSARDHVNNFHENTAPPWLHALYTHWRRLYQETYKGVSNDGTIRPNLFPIQDEGVPVPEIVSAINSLLSQLTPAQKSAVCYHIDAPEWRSWSNPEFYFSQKGIRLEEVTPEIRASVLRVLEVTLSPEGYAKAVAAMRINHFLGEICACPGVMNEDSYNFCVFGEPSTSAPFGFSFYGHHLCLNVFLYRSQIIVSPWFTGAEPNEIDAGPHAGTRILHVEEDLGLRLMQSLPEETQKKCQIYAQMHDPAMPPGRWNMDDQRHLCGAYRDNAVVPYEGALVSSLSPDQQSLIWSILEQYLLYLPHQSRTMKLASCRAVAHETYFSWIGGYGREDPFYYRVQSPLLIVEFDHHSGVFLGNGEPAKFHIHTILRTPNAGDYGVAVRRVAEGDVGSFMWDSWKQETMGTAGEA